MQKLFLRRAIIGLGCAIAMAHPIWGVENNSSNYSTVVVKNLSEKQLKALREQEEDGAPNDDEKREEKALQEELVNLVKGKNGGWFLTFRSKEAVKVIEELLQWDKESLEERVDEQDKKLDKAGKDIGAHLETITQLQKKNDSLQAPYDKIFAHAQSWSNTLSNPKAYAPPGALIVAWIGTHYVPRFAGGKKVKRLLGVIGVQKRRRKKRRKRLQV